MGHDARQGNTRSYRGEERDQKVTVRPVLNVYSGSSAISGSGGDSGGGRGSQRDDTNLATQHTFIQNDLVTKDDRLKVIPQRHELL